MVNCSSKFHSWQPGIEKSLSVLDPLCLIWQPLPVTTTENYPYTRSLSIICIATCIATFPEKLRFTEKTNTDNQSLTNADWRDS